VASNRDITSAFLSRLALASSVSCNQIQVLCIAGPLQYSPFHLSHSRPQKVVCWQACRPPHVNIDRLRNDLFEAGFAQHAGVSDKRLPSADELMAKLLELNDRLLSEPDSYWLNSISTARTPAAVKALDKARLHRFMLGMDNRWLLEMPRPAPAKKA
jgi:hypothetical protein